MALTRFYVDRCEPDLVAGWIDQTGPTSRLTIKINGEWVCDLSPTQYRADLREAGLGDGKRAFSFSPEGYLSGPINKISLSLDGKEIYFKIVKSIGNKIIRVNSKPDKEQLFTHIDIDDYPIKVIPRWGYGKPSHQGIADILNRKRENFSELLRQLSECCGVLESVPQENSPDLITPFWRNGFFESFDAAALVGMLCSKKPSCYMEIGSGNSTKFARFAVEKAHLATSIISIDPEPRASVDSLCDRLIRRRLEDCDLSTFDQLESGDFLFFDGSHRVFTNSDVTVFFFGGLAPSQTGRYHSHSRYLSPMGLSARLEHKDVL
jgi:hypothetical protein